MPHIGLYYPYIHCRDERWMKAAALFLPRLARVAPPGFPPADAGVAQVLKDELDFFIDVDPTPAAHGVAPIFSQALTQHLQALPRRFGHAYDRLKYRGVRKPDPNPLMRADEYGNYDLAWPRRITDKWPELVAIHVDEFAPDLRQALHLWDLAEPGYTRPDGRTPVLWLAMDPALAWIYKCALTDEIARRTAYMPITDQPTAHAVTGNWDADRLASALFAYAPNLDGSSLSDAPLDAPASDMVNRVGYLAVRCAMPRDLRSVPIAKIIRLRKRYVAEFDAFTDAVASTATEMREALGAVEDEAALQEHLRLAVRRRFETPLADLTAAMKGLNVTLGYSAIGYKVELGTAAAASVGGLAAGSPLVTAGALAFGTASLRHSNAQTRDALLRDSQAAFLLRVENDLQPRSLIRRVLRGTARITGVGV